MRSSKTPEHMLRSVTALDPRAIGAGAVSALTHDWQRSLPTLQGNQAVLRELRLSDAPSLFALLAPQEVSRFISPPPASAEGFVRFIKWARRQRAAGAHVCFAVTLSGFDTAIGLFQVRQLDPHFETAEWGFALGSAFWGTGVLGDSAERVLDVTFGTLGVRRLEARAAVLNGRGNGALVKIGAAREAVLRKSLVRDGHALDQLLYAIVDSDRRTVTAPVRRAFIQTH